ncbi:MAG: RNA polymerase sigma 70 [Blastomonas sp. CACIA14H2]|jgi:RNA polymerase sigma factor (sigma-70 family)|uniref:sigma-70 family RNA polymerase sigma factor n=1 Tax=unclassified Blastomonas TaxID=2626550 RepID=UPI0003CFAE7D|nr:sigma-70 family RNA polymerase sigma factor [Blastomonas sp. UPD001]ESZ87504.1 MAG: RNA polymerase sigma 70 [Blastomonas sp. CACIA14H2]
MAFDTTADAAPETGPPLDDEAFKAQLASLIPHLRAYGRSLSGNRDVADDLVQDTMLKAWAARGRFAAGTNMRAWTFIILRNSFLSQRRRARFTTEWDDVVADRILSMPAGQGDQLHLADVQRALMQLPESQREALILVGAGGFSYEEAADICGVALGTIKSRVARGRAALAALIEETGNGESRIERTTDPMAAIMADVDRVSGGLLGRGGDED